MLKKIVPSLGIVLLLSFASCGGGSKEAKELLQKILTVIGFPPNVITNICQTSNSSDVCEGMELNNNKAENSKTKTWQKITETGVGQYLLETNNPCEPILLKLQDDDVVYDSGEFFLKFSGVESGQTTKELSILEAMVDASYILPNDVSFIKRLDSSEAQNSFYATLYQDLKININILRTSGLTQTQAIRGSLREMATELIGYGVNKSLPDKLNRCENDTICINKELKLVSNRLLIDTNETSEIVATEQNNNASLQVNEVSCLEPKKDEKRLAKIEFLFLGAQIKMNYFYKEDKLIQTNIYFVDENTSFSSIVKNEYSKDKVRSVSEDGSFSEVLFEDDLYVESRDYDSNHTLESSIKIEEFDAQNRPLREVETEYGSSGIETTTTYLYTYEGDYLVSSREINENSETLYSYTYDREYGCFTYESLLRTSMPPSDWECMNWITKTNESKGYGESETFTDNQTVTYDKDGLPIRMEIQYSEKNSIAQAFSDGSSYMNFEYN